MTRRIVERTISVSSEHGLYSVPDVQPVDDNERRPRKDIDRGYAWVILAASFLGFLIQGAIMKTSTILYQQVILKFDVSATEAGLVTGIHGTVKMFSSPFVSALFTKFDIRKVSFIGGIMFSIGVLLCSFAPSIYYIYGGFGVISALGSNAGIMASIVMQGTYFDKWKSRAMSIAMSGLAVGAFAGAPLMNFLFDHYGFSGTLLIQSGIIMHVCVTAALQRPLPTPATPDNPPNHQLPTKGKQRVPASSLYDEKKTEPNQSNHQQELKEIEMPMVNSGNESDKKTVPSKGTVVCSKVAKTTGLFLCGRPVFMAKCLLLFAMQSVLMCGLIYMGPLAVETCNMSPLDIALLLSIASLIEIPVKILSGIFFDLKWIKQRRSLFYGILGIITGFSFCIPPFASGLYSFMVCWCFYVSLIFAFHPLVYTVMGDIVGKENLNVALGLCRTTMGVGTLVGTSTLGLIKDTLGMYSYGFYICGVNMSVCSLVFILVNWKFTTHKQTQQQQEAA